jgi:basic amino acid/polyamine antiporter, APA family
LESLGTSSSDVVSPPSGDSDVVAPRGLFVRKSSGLVRELGVRDAFAINIGGVAPTGVVGFAFLATTALFPQSDLTWPLLIAFLGTAVLCLMYSQLVASMPRDGADFIYSARVIHPALGAAVGFAFLITFLFLGCAIWLTLFANTFLPFVSQTLGSVFHSHALTTFAGTLSQKGWVVGVSGALSLLTGWLLMRRVGVIARTTYYAVGFGILAIVVFILEVVFHSPGAFRHAYDTQAGSPTAYTQVIAAAHKAGLATGVTAAAVLASIAQVNVFYGGVTYANYTGGELRKPGWTFRASTLLCLAITLVLSMAAWLAVKHVMGLTFIQSSGWLSTNDPTSYAKVAGGVNAFMPNYVFMIASNPVSKLIIAFGFLGGAAAIVLATAAVLSRLLFALSFDRILPPAVARVREKSHAPAIAAALLTVLMFAAAVLTIYTSVLTTLRNLSLVLSGVFVISSIVATILPWRRRDLYDQAPKVVGKQIFGIPAITVIGAVSAIYWAIALYLGATKTQVSGGYDTASILTLVGTCVIGLIAYVISRIVMSRKGLDLDLALHELPPE